MPKKQDVLPDGPQVTTGAETVTPVGRLLTHMAVDPILHAAFLRNPGLVIASAGLTTEEEGALNAGSWDQIKEFLGTGGKPTPPDPPPTQGGGGSGG